MPLNNESQTDIKTRVKIRLWLREIIHLRNEVDEEGTINDIRKNIEFKGANFWTLVCAILIASIGLNTNSTAVIIGAMLISPLMGPIMGAGLALGTNDIDLLKRSLRNLGIAVLASILTSALYFLLTPLDLVQSELLARTKPTVFDVLIAFFGGLTGIVASSRKEKSNAIPGVAIATALMPPLCTAGFGLATWNLPFFWGAFYLFLINSVFICLSTFLVVRYLHFKRVSFLDQKREQRVKIWISTFALLTILPSIYAAWEVVQETLFQREANKFIQEQIQFSDSEIINTKLGYQRQGSTIEITLIGEPLPKKEILNLKQKLRNNPRLSKAELKLHQPRTGSLEIEKQFTKLNQDLRVGIVEDLYTKNEAQLKEKDAQIQKQQDTIKGLEQSLLKYQADTQNLAQLAAEIKTQYPTLNKIAFSQLNRTDLATLKTQTVPTFFCTWQNKPTADQEKRLKAWLLIRLKLKELKLVNFPL